MTPMWEHPFDRDDASAEMLLLSRACDAARELNNLERQGLAYIKKDGEYRAVELPEWAAAAIAAAQAKFPGFEPISGYCPAWREEEASVMRAHHAAHDSSVAAEKAQLRDSLAPVIERKDWAALIDMGVTLGQIEDAAEGYPEHEHWRRRVKAAERNRELAITRTGLIAPPTPNKSIKSMRMR